MADPRNVLSSVDDICDALTAADDPAPVLLRGTAHSGKSRVLAAVGRTLRRRGVEDVVIEDDAHDLEPDRLARLQRLVEDGERVLVAMAPRPGDRRVQALVGAVRAVGHVVELRPFTVDEIAALRAPSGDRVGTDRARRILELTGGTRNGVRAVVAELHGSEKPRLDECEAAARRWITEVLQAADPVVLSVLPLTAAGCGLDPVEVAAVSDTDIGTARAVVDRVRTCGLVSESDALLPAAVAPLRTVSGDSRFRATLQQVCATRIDADTLDPATARALVANGLRGSRVADVLCGAAEDAELADAATFYRAAIDAGANRETFAARHCAAELAAGDLDEAAAIADRIVTAPDAESSDLANAVTVLGAVWSNRGSVERSAELYRWLGPDRAGSAAGLAATTLLAVGDIGCAREFLGIRLSGPPTDAAAGAAQLGAAVLGSFDRVDVVRESVRAANTLGSTVAAAAVPGSAAVIAALACVHRGDAARAREVVTRALAIDRPGSPTWRHHHTVAAWCALFAGDDEQASAISSTIALDVASPATARDALFDSALRVALARRSGDHGRLAAAWEPAAAVLHDVTVDLFTMLPIGELWLAAIRLGRTETVRHVVDELTHLLERTGEPALWSPLFHWYGVQAAILAERPDDMLPHAHALKHAALTGDSYASVLATAGAVWLRVLQNHADVAEVERAAIELDSIGLSWDAARLTSEAALRVDDTAHATTLLQLARSLRQDARGGSTETSDRPAGTGLTEREADVAHLVVLGLTYREIGERLYISAKTVEHHVARIRRRVDAGSRSEMMSLLRSMGFGSATTVL